MSNLISIRFLGVLVLLGFGGFITFLLYNGLVDIHKDNFLCYGAKRYYNVGNKLVLFSIGNVRIKYQPAEWGCTPERRYDGTKYRIINGELQGK